MTAMVSQSPIIGHLPKFIAEKGKILEKVGIDAGKAEIEIILCSILDCDRLFLYLRGTTQLTQERLRRFDDILARRATRYPLQYILEESWFYGRKFFVSPAVMVPTPETEILCDTAMRFIKQRNLINPRLLDVGVGSGVISVTLANEIKDSQIIALDVSPDAIAVAKRNAEALGGADRIEFRRSDFFTAVKPDEKFDLILSNPPYISDDEYRDLPPEVLADPKISLTSGSEGLDAISHIIATAPTFLAPGGRVMFEIGYNQADRVAEITERDGRYRSIAILRDLNDIDRVVILGCDAE
ncbi:MAG: peptide chain release factor N(5)-glutamine methyltransferase [candidate division Zixibacteria bacterium]|nr:peptide chain release factor N(5)-glutamine methyltransferase [candidate division Zixibacteria bacterium]